MTAYSVRRLSGCGLSGSPPSEPFSSLKRATRFIISSRVQVRVSLQSLIAPPPVLAGILRESGGAFQRVSLAINYRSVMAPVIIRLLAWAGLAVALHVGMARFTY